MFIEMWTGGIILGFDGYVVIEGGMREHKWELKLIWPDESKGLTEKLEIEKFGNVEYFYNREIWVMNESLNDR